MSDAFSVNYKYSDHLSHRGPDFVMCRCFRQNDIKVKCGGGILRGEVATLFENLRSRVEQYAGKGIPLHINSGLRCREYNAYIGGEEDSRHIYGEALDIQCPGSIPLEVFWRLAIETNSNGGIGFYTWWKNIMAPGGKGGVHLDIAGKRHWYSVAQGETIRRGLPSGI